MRTLRFMSLRVRELSGMQDELGITNVGFVLGSQAQAFVL